MSTDIPPSVYRLLDLINTLPTRQVRFTEIPKDLHDAFAIASAEGFLEQAAPPSRLPSVLPPNMSEKAKQQLAKLAGTYNEDVTNPIYFLSIKGRAELARHRESLRVRSTQGVRKPSLDTLRQPLNRAMECAKRIAELSGNVLNGQDSLDEIRRNRRDLPHLNKQVMASFDGDASLAADLQHHLDCLKEDAESLADWIGPVWEETQRLYNSIGTTEDTPRGIASQRWNQARNQAFKERERRRQIVLESCNRAFKVANKICVATDKAIAAQALSDHLLQSTRQHIGTSNLQSTDTSDAHNNLPKDQDTTNRAGVELDKKKDTKKKQGKVRPRNLQELQAVQRKITRDKKQGLTQQQSVREYVEQKYHNLKTEKQIESKVTNLIRSLNRCVDGLINR
jgi:hypothetical protein